MLKKVWNWFYEDAADIDEVPPFENVEQWALELSERIKRIEHRQVKHGAWLNWLFFCFAMLAIGYLSIGKGLLGA